MLYLLKHAGKAKVLLVNCKLKSNINPEYIEMILGGKAFYPLQQYVLLQAFLKYLK